MATLARGAALTEPARHSPPIARGALALVVLVVHAVLLALWPRPAERTSVVPSAPRVLSITLPTLQAPPAPTVTAAPLSPRVARSPTPPGVARPAAPGPDGATPAIVAAPAAPASLEAASALPPADSAPALQLALPQAASPSASGSTRDRALADPRTVSARPTLADRVAAVAGTAHLAEERVDAARTRFRQRGKCIEVHVSRDAQINPWNQNHAPTPRGVKPEC